jgi:hypothetical protein
LGFELVVTSNPEAFLFKNNLGEASFAIRKAL